MPSPRQQSIRNFLASAFGDHSDEEESAKRKRSREAGASDEEGEHVRIAGDGSLLTNTSLLPVSSRPRVEVSGDVVAKVDNIVPLSEQNFNVDESKEESSPNQPLARMAVDEDLKMTWDNSDVNFGVVHFSTPRPKPFPETDEGDGVALLAEIRKLVDEKVGSLRSEILSALDVVGKNVTDTILEKVDNVEAKVDRVRGRLDEMEQEIVELRGSLVAVEGRVGSNSQGLNRIDNDLRQQQEGLVRLGETVQARMVNEEQVAIAMQELQERVTMLETTISNSQNTNGEQTANAMRALQERIVSLESNNISSQNTRGADVAGLGEREIERLRRGWQNDDDRYYLATIQISGFGRTQIRGRGDRRAAKSVLQLVGAESLLADVERVWFAADTRLLRLTFRSQFLSREAISYLSAGAAQIKRSGAVVPITFKQLLPPRFMELREKLFRVGKVFKREGKCDRFEFVISDGKLVLQCYRRGRRSELISEEHLEVVDQMEEGDDNSTEEGPTCPVCIGSLRSGDLVEMICGHRAHEKCVQVSLSQNIGCMVCRCTPAIFPQQFQCTRCEQTERDEIDDDVGGVYQVAIKCGHVHRRSCHQGYRDIWEDYPLGPESVDTIMENDGPGCEGCLLLEPLTDVRPMLYKKIVFESGMSVFRGSNGMGES